MLKVTGLGNGVCSRKAKTMRGGPGTTVESRNKYINKVFIIKELMLVLFEYIGFVLAETG